MQGEVSGSSTYSLRGKILQGVVVSALVHVAVLIVLLIVPSFSRQRIFSSPVYTVDLVGGIPASPGKSTSAGEISVTPPKSTPKEEKKAETKKPAKVEKVKPAEKIAQASPTTKAKEPDAQKTTTDADDLALPVKKTESLKKAEPSQTDAKRQADEERVKRSIEELQMRRAIEDLQTKVAVANLRRGLSESPQTSSPSPRKGVAPQGAGSGAAGGGLSRQILDIKFKGYYNQILDSVQKAWVAPEGLSRGKNLLVVVMSVQIRKDGRVDKVWIEESSGNSYFDETARRAVAKAQPFPPPPEVSDNGLFEFGLRFHDPRSQRSTLP